MANSHDSDTMGIDFGVEGQVVAINHRLINGARTSVRFSPCRLWDGPVVQSKRSSNHYGRVSVWVQALHAHRSERVHRLMYEIYYKERLGEHQCDHVCCNTLCLNPEHLRKVTHKQNISARDERRKAKMQ